MKHRRYRKAAAEVLEVHEDAERVYAVLEELSSDNLFMLPTRVRDIWEKKPCEIVKIHEFQ